MNIRSGFNSLTIPGQIKSLDGVRAVAVLLVLITHICQRIPGLSFIHWNTEWATPLYNGWIGVDLFFVLSGFLIGSMIVKGLNHNTFSTRAFYIHRFFRILPAYFAVVLLVITIRGLFPHQAAMVLPAFNTKDIMASFALLTDYIPVDIGIPSWSLSIEEHFYLLLPCFLILVRNTENRIKTMIFLIFAALICRMVTYRLFSISETYPLDALVKLIYIPFHDRMDALSVGVLIALIQYQFQVESKIPRFISCYLGLLLVGFVLISGALQGGFFYTTIQYTLVCLGFGGFLWGVLGNSIQPQNLIQTIMASRIWIPFARISYSVYLTHLLAISILSHLITFKPWMFPLILMACLLAAIPLYLLIEYPFHQFGKKLFIKNNTSSHATEELGKDALLFPKPQRVN